MQIVRTMLCLIAFVGVLPALARDVALGPVTFSDGAIGTVNAECGAGDLCAAIKLPNGDVLSIYNGGSTRCKPYTLNLVRTHGDTVLFTSSTNTDDQSSNPFFGKGNCMFKTTFLTFDNGLARLQLDLSKDGSLFAAWIATAPAATNPL